MSLETLIVPNGHSSVLDLLEIDATLANLPIKNVVVGQA
jgi:hypothetical protein